MLPLTHIFISKKVAGRENNYLAFGSILPDVRVNGKSDLITIHENPFVFFDFVKQYHPDLHDLGLGAVLHTMTSRGADYYSDEEKIGYAKIMGRKIHKEVSELLGSNDKKYRPIDHNFIEAAMDLEIQKIDNMLLAQLESAYNGLDSPEVFKCLADFAKASQDIVKQETDGLTKDAFDPRFFENAKTLSQNTIKRVIKIRYGLDVDTEETANLLALSQDLIRDSFEQFLEDTISKMRQDFPSYAISPKK